MEQEKQNKEVKKYQFRQKANIQKNEYYTERPELQKGGTSFLRKQFNRGLSIFVVMVCAILLYFALLRLEEISNLLALVLDVLKPITYGLALAYLINPIVKFVEAYVDEGLERFLPQVKNKEKISRIVGIFSALIFLFAIIIGLVNMMLPELVKSIRSMVITLPAQLNNAVDNISHMTINNTVLGGAMTKVLEEAADYIATWMRTDLLAELNVLMSNVTVGVLNVVLEVFNFAIGIFISVYLLMSKETFSRQCKKIIYAVCKPETANMVLHMTSKSNGYFGGFIIGKIIDSAIIGVLCFIGLTIIDMPYTMLVSVVVGVTNVIPFFGPYIGAIPCAVLILLTDPKMGLYFIIFIFALQQLDGNVIGPKILGDSTGLSPFWVMFAILVGGGLFGVLGMILGVPTFAVIYYVVKMLIEHKLDKKNLPIDTKCYDELSYVTNQGEYVHSDNKTADEEENENSIEEQEGEE
ncbi:MAG: AI-2E family transporter [Schaedlerella sp.]|nr:AI-2E family transporter [Schaedlerella sp.]